MAAVVVLTMVCSLYGVCPVPSRLLLRSIQVIPVYCTLAASSRDDRTGSRCPCCPSCRTRRYWARPGSFFFPPSNLPLPSKTLPTYGLRAAKPRSPGRCRTQRRSFFRASWCSTRPFWESLNLFKTHPKYVPLKWNSFALLTRLE